ncbi:MAG: SdrD B-like domain-containing protein [Chloroflexota bacterium]
MRSIRLVSILVVIGLLTISLPLTAVASPADEPRLQAANLLTNGDFEAGFQSSGVANGWGGWWIDTSECSRRVPIFRQITSSTDARRVQAGSSAQQLLGAPQSGGDSGGTFLGGIIQQARTGITPGKTYRFTVWASAWFSTGDNAAASENTGSTNIQIGIANGVVDAASITTRSSLQNIKDRYVQLSIDIVANTNALTVATYANPDSCAKHTEVFFDSATLTEVGAAPAGTTAPTQPPQPTLRVIPTKFPTPSPNAEGKILYTVQSGNTIIDICGVIGRGSDPTCIDDILKWNGISNPKGIYVGQQLIIGQGAAGAVQPTATTPPTAAPAATEASGQPTVDPNTQPTTDPNAQPTAAVVSPTQASGGAASICVTLFNDANGNGVFDPGEGLVAAGSFSLLDVSNSNTVATYTTDGASEPHCFETLPSGNYRINSNVPEGYKATTRSDWDLTLAAGSTANLEFGAQSTGQTGGGATGGGTDGGGSDNTSRLVRALLAAGGVVLLLIAAGVAGFLVLTRRR